MDRFKKSKDGKIVIRERNFFRNEGPFRFSYVFIHRAEEGNDIWKFLSVKKDGFSVVKDCDRRLREELVKKHGKRALAIAYAIAKKEEKVPEKMFQDFQLQLV